MYTWCSLYIFRIVWNSTNTITTVTRHSFTFPRRRLKKIKHRYWTFYLQYFLYFYNNITIFFILFLLLYKISVRWNPQSTKFQHANTYSRKYFREPNSITTVARRDFTFPRGQLTKKWNRETLKYAIQRNFLKDVELPSLATVHANFKQLYYLRKFIILVSDSTHCESCHAIFRLSFCASEVASQELHVAKQRALDRVASEHWLKHRKCRFLCATRSEARGVYLGEP